MDEKLTITVFSFNRYPHLKLCLSWLLHHDLAGCKVIVRDDASTDPRVLEWLRHLASENKISLRESDVWITRTNREGKEARLGIQRANALDEFMEDPEQGEFLVLLDDDIITTAASIRDAIRGYNLLKCARVKPAAYTLHAWLTSHGFRKLNGEVYAKVRVTGESCLLFGREELMIVGNHFGPHNKGFADTQFQAIERAGYTYCTRVSPPHQVQHTGIGSGGSSIYIGQIPSWVREPYQHTYPESQHRRWIDVKGFDIKRYMQILSHFPADRAPLAMLAEMKELS